MFLRNRFTGIALIVVLAVGGLFVFRQFEWYPPRIQVDLERAVLGRRPFVVRVDDRGKGLTHVSVALVANGESRPIHFREFEPSRALAEIPVRLDPERHELKDGAAVLTITALDRSYWGFFRGNKATFEKTVEMDFSPPVVEVVSGDRYVTQGGSGLVAYRTSPDTERSGVRIGRYSFRGYRGHLPDRDVAVAFFSHPYDVPASERAVIFAQDHAGNERESMLVYDVRPLRFRRVKMRVSDDFIQRKIAPLAARIGDPGGTARERFLKVNRNLRRDNEETVHKACRASATKKLWDGRFVQLANSAVQANFADHRSYYYRGRKIDESWHLGYDLAVTRRYPVGAANSGTVKFAGELGIYGNTVIIDHGLGLCTLYSHLSSVAVAPGDTVLKGARIGRTGETGLALGDHLHYGVYIQGVAVLPLEWWDAKWIRDNVSDKLDGLKSGAEPSSDAPPPHASAD